MSLIRGLAAKKIWKGKQKGKKKGKKAQIDKSLSLPSRAVQEVRHIPAIAIAPKLGLGTGLEIGKVKEIKISEAKTPRSPRGSSGSDIEPLPAAGLALAQFDGVCSMIKDNLFLGSETIARDVAALRRANVTHILNCAGTICPNYHPKVFQYKTLFLSDGKMEDFTCLFYDDLEWMEEA